MYYYNSNAAATIHPGTIDTTSLVMADFLGRGSTLPGAVSWGDSGNSVFWDDNAQGGTGNGNTNGDKLDGLYVQFPYLGGAGWWDLGVAADRVVVFTSQDHGPYPAEGLEYRVYGCSDLWNSASCSSTQATLTDVYLDGWLDYLTQPCNDYNNNGWCSDDVSAALHLDGSYRYIKLVAWDPTGGFSEPEIDAVARWPTPYKCYSIPQHLIPAAPIFVSSQFGVDLLAFLDAESLCAPALKDGEGDLTWPHLKCYEMKPGHDPPDVVNLTDQFEAEINVPVGPGIRFCEAVSKWGAGLPPPSTPPPLHYECFSIPSHFVAAMVTLETQFGPNPVKLPVEAESVCAPALKTGEGDLTAPDLKCYKIFMGDDPLNVVNLTDQFGDELDVPVGQAVRVCDAVRKEVISGVGGIAELPALPATSPAESAASAGGSGWSAGSYAALAAGLAAAVLALGAGGWYARRRRLR